MLAVMWCVAVTSRFLLSVSAADFYTAAVYDHAVSHTPSSANITSRVDALRIMERNLDTLASEAAEAASQGADIFVFPEYGISGFLPDDFLITSYFSEVIPGIRPSAVFCPCLEDFVQSGQEVLHRLSCVAKQNNMYLAANMGDMQPCIARKHAGGRGSGGGLNCPLLGHYQYNTEVVFNRQGCLVTKYHKQHLFERETLRWNRPKQVDISYFDTDFGRFGLMICFDVVFKSPAVDLVEQYNVTDIIFSTAWMNVYPHYVSIAYHSGWARTMDVNFLASNLHYPFHRFVGSGIYGPQGVIDYAYNRSSDLGALIVAQVPINRRSEALEKSLFIRPVASLPSHKQANDSSFSSKVFDDMFMFRALVGDSGNVTVCNGTVCCNLEFLRSVDSELYALGVFNGMHHLEGKYYMEICLLVRCADNEAEHCGTEIASRTVTDFISFNLTAVMTTKYAYPEVVSPDFNFTTDWEFTDDHYIKTIVGVNKKVASVVLMGRNFDKDHVTTYSGAINVGSAGRVSSPVLLLLCVVAIQLPFYNTYLCR